MHESYIAKCVILSKFDTSIERTIHNTTNHTTSFLVNIFLEYFSFSHWLTNFKFIRHKIIIVVLIANFFLFFKVKFFECNSSTHLYFVMLKIQSSRFVNSRQWFERKKQKNKSEINCLTLEHDIVYYRHDEKKRKEIPRIFE